MQTDITKNKVSSKQIILAFCKKYKNAKKANMYFPNTYLDIWEADIFELTGSGYLYEYEIKISRSDFKNDVKKEKKYFSGTVRNKHREIMDGKRCNYFYFVVPENLVTVNEIPYYAGLIYFKQTVYNDSLFPEHRLFTEFIIVKSAPKLHKDKLNEKIKIKLLLSTYYRFHALWK